MGKTCTPLVEALPAKTPDSPSVARLIVAVSRSLERYEAKDLPGALACLEGFQARTLPECPEWLATELERDCAAALRGAPVVGPALDCIGLARERIRQELGEPVQFAVMPVRLALVTALCCLGAGRPWTRPGREG